ncbi:hypothetical protein FACS1894200_13690 [Spirochaetia bacterium]|nr:hypothetical protein FACS1894200_13690 [Spirochaetia bacterium]
MDHLAIIQDYKNNPVGCVRNDKVIKYCKESPDFVGFFPIAGNRRFSLSQPQKRHIAFTLYEILPRCMKKYTLE